MYQAIETSLKTQTRRPITPTNCSLTRGTLGQVDFSSGRPDQLQPVSSLRCRLETAAGDRRSTVIIPRIRASQLLWCRRGQTGMFAKRSSAQFLLRVDSVAPVRLNDISEADALAEGVLIFCPPELRADDHPVPLKGAYRFQLEQLGRIQRQRWAGNMIHREVEARGTPTARDCFALLWESINGPGSWALNPWVWCYRFEKVLP